MEDYQSDTKNPQITFIELLIDLGDKKQKSQEPISTQEHTVSSEMKEDDDDYKKKLEKAEGEGSQKNS